MRRGRRGAGQRLLDTNPKREGGDRRNVTPPFHPPPPAPPDPVRNPSPSSPHLSPVVPPGAGQLLGAGRSGAERGGAEGQRHPDGSHRLPLVEIPADPPAAPQRYTRSRQPHQAEPGRPGGSGFNVLRFGIGAGSPAAHAGDGEAAPFPAHGGGRRMAGPGGGRGAAERRRCGAEVTSGRCPEVPPTPRPRASHAPLAGKPRPLFPGRDALGAGHAPSSLLATSPSGPAHRTQSPGVQWGSAEWAWPSPLPVGGA